MFVTSLTSASFAQPRPGHVELTELGQPLRTEHPARLTNALDQENAFNRREAATITGLLEAVRTGQPVWTALWGRDFWTDQDQDQELSDGFDRAMSGFPELLATWISQGYDWASAQHVVDVGGGTGRILAELLTSHPRLRGTLVDLPRPAAEAADRFDQLGIAGRATALGQSFFDPLPTDGDVYLLANVLHCWNDEDSRKILGQCASAAAPGSRIVMVDQVVPAETSGLDQDIVETDLGLLLLFGAKIRSEREFRALGESAGLTLSETTPLVSRGGWSLLTYRIDD